MKHRLSVQQYLTLAAVMLTASIGDTLLAHGMKQMGVVNLHHPLILLQALLNPFVILGTLLLIGFFAAYMTALSWADLTFVMPSTGFGYVLIALLSRFWLHEHISVSRWAGIFLITCAVGFVANGPSRTDHGLSSEPIPEAVAGPTVAAMREKSNTAALEQTALEQVNSGAAR